jgi:hypothetical protein
MSDLDYIRLRIFLDGAAIDHEAGELCGRAIPVNSAGRTIYVSSPDDAATEQLGAPEGRWDVSMYGEDGDLEKKASSASPEGAFMIVKDWLEQEGAR